ncbi:Transcriptional regulator of nonfermentable carbon utilization [Emmonsiellopsis sp. PD_33]|nr:Transcriptional regulator of nonfermentable carbon utilization [Emmonsiellopsis sp. PD_33]KAK2806926.1 Transcriptional regulator of nonfermentable carbon utilization [Onygenales sp. PD_10]
MTVSARNGSPSPSPALSTTGDQDSGNMTAATTAHPDHSSEPQSQTNGKPSGAVQNGQKPASTAANAKDPLRPRRKKAKRACFACQRAHLTCGDERPCQRCIKRGLQDACHDGVRKKAKYLHDAPNEALMPGIRGNLYNQAHAVRNNLAQSRNGNSSKPPHQDGAGNFYQPQANNYNVYSQGKSQQQMAPPLMQDATMNTSAFQAQSPNSPAFDLTTNNQNQNLNSSLPQTSSASSSAPGQNQDPFGAAFFDPSHPALFNFDIASMNFGNRYGALEFGMLGHMATGAGDTPPSDSATQRGSIGRSGSGTFASPNFGDGSSGQSPFLFGDPVLNDWAPTGQSQTNPRNIYNQNTVSNLPDLPHAFAIESGPVNFASPSSTESPQMASTTPFDDANANFSSRTNLMPQNTQQPPRISTPSLKNQGLHVGGKRRYRSPSAIYDSVKEPYSYTSGFHSLTAFIQRRFSPQKTLQIAKALASIRPSFIATTKTLNQDDLVFMEKCFQRTLWEYEDFINACGTPTIVCRRTGEIAAVGKEFSILTGWKKEVLLGKEPNLNVNTGGSSSASAGPSSRGSFTPRIPTLENANPGRTQPVFLAELLDDESVIEFYEDFAKLAFGDSRGSVMTTCKLLKYKTKEDTALFKGEPGSDETGGQTNGINGSDANGNSPSNGAIHRSPNQSQKHNQKWAGKGGIAGEAGMNQLGFRDGKVECSYCWTVKRDVFDIPMLIVMNFLPCI